MAKISIDNEDLFEIQKVLQTFKGNKIVIQRATNDTLSGLKTESVKLVGAKVTAKAVDIRNAFKIKKMFKNDLTANIDCTGKPLPLIKYSVNTVKKAWGPNAGVSVKVLKANKRTVIKHAFKATMKSGHEGVFWRTQLFGKTFRPKYNYGLFKEFYGSPKNIYRSIHELYGPPIPDIFDDADIIKPAMKHASERLDARLEHHTNRLIDAAR